MDKRSDDFRICDTCRSFEVSPGGCREKCHQVFIARPVFTEYEFEQRRDGVFKSCREYQKLA